MFKQAFRLITSVMGHEQTNSEQLDKIGRELFEDKWNGVFARDTILPDEQGYYICNLDTSYQPGSHWTAIVRRGKILFYFDSFARSQRSTLKLKDPNYVIVSEANPTIKQHVKEQSCGQYCLAWLLVWDRDPQEALSI